MSQSGRPGVHLLLRFSDDLYRTGRVIERHQDVLEAEGAVWWGKLGRPVGPARLRQLQEQVSEGTATYVFLVQRRARSYQIFQGLGEAFRAERPAGDERFIPAYYDALGLDRYIGTWIKLSSLMEAEPGTLREYVISSSGAPALQTLTKSMAAMFFIQRRRKARPASAQS